MKNKHKNLIVNWIKKHNFCVVNLVKNPVAFYNANIGLVSSFLYHYFILIYFLSRDMSYFEFVFVF